MSTSNDVQRPEAYWTAGVFHVGQRAVVSVAAAIDGHDMTLKVL